MNDDGNEKEDKQSSASPNEAALSDFSRACAHSNDDDGKNYISAPSRPWSSHRHCPLLSFFIQISNGIRRALVWTTSGKRLAFLWLCILCYSLWYVNFWTYFREQTAGGDFYTEGAYVDPRTVEIGGSGDKNLLIVYCESIEETFGNPAIMGEDLLDPLRPYIGTPNLHIEQMPGADFTMGGIVASQCGIPMKSISILSGNLTGWSLGEFLPGAVCLGDVLSSAGYYNVYYNGSSGLFSGLNKFFLGHGYKEFTAKEEWIQKRPDLPLNTWALYDSDLIDLCMERLDALMAEKRKFCLTLSTMDTHEPGFLSPVCQGKCEDNWPGYIRCSLSQVGRLLAHIRDKGWEEQFVILVMGDHATRMPKLGKGDLKHAEGRFVLCSLTGAGDLVPVQSQITHFDLFPTVLSALGFEVKGGRLGFGYDAFSKEATPPKDSHKELRNRVLSPSKHYEKLWFPAER